MYTPDNLACRHWTSEHIRSYAIALAHHGCTDVLASLEPLHLIREDSTEGVLLWAAYNVACGLLDVAVTAVELALARWPEDERLARMRDAMSTQKEPAR